MGTKRLQFATKTDINGNTYNLVIDIEDKTFARDKYWVYSDFIRISKKDMNELILKLIWLGFEEVM